MLNSQPIPLKPIVPKFNTVEKYMPHKFIRVLLCYMFEVEVNVVMRNNIYYVNIVVSPSVEFFYTMSDGMAWKFKSFDDAWRFIDSHPIFDLSLILIELNDIYSSAIYEFKKTAEYNLLYNVTMNAKESLGVFKVYEEVIRKERANSLSLYAKFNYCQDTFGGYGYLYKFTYNNDFKLYSVKFKPTELAHFVDLNMSIRKIVKTITIPMMIEVSESVIQKTHQLQTDGNYEKQIAKLNRIEYVTAFMEFLIKYQ